LNRSQGVTIFLTTQYMEEADRLCDEVAIINAGNIVAQGSPAVLKASIGSDVLTVTIEGGEEPAARALALFAAAETMTDARFVDGAVVIYTKDGARAVPQVVRMLDEAGLEAATITVAHPTLDDVFLRKTGHHLEADAALPAKEAS
jgi:ABC-2 type transport system ATP-binding protein